jgi:probable HAF family extracellular repeat protein
LIKRTALYAAGEIPFQTEIMSPWDADKRIVQQHQLPGAMDTQPFGINDKGDIVGTYFDHAGFSPGFLMSMGNFSAIQFPGAFATQARGINSVGDIVGTFLDASGSHSFRFSDGAFTVTDVAGVTPTRNRGINARGDISGNYD